MKRLILIFLTASCSQGHDAQTVITPTPVVWLETFPTVQPPFEFIPAQIFQPENPTPSPAPALIVQDTDTDTVSVPILLYHHIETSPINSQYYVSSSAFEEQLSLLAYWGCTTITTDMLVSAIEGGENLPPCPIIITFDDGNLDNYTNAFPIMRKYGFVGVIYVVGSYINADGYMTSGQIRELLAAGWELGSHTMNHIDLTTAPPEQRVTEISASKKYLENEFAVTVSTLAYPFGAYDSSIMDAAYSSGYRAAMGLGNTGSHRHFELYALPRLTVRGGLALDNFAALLVALIR